ncbi:protoporphyrinogen oxidase HemJ [Amaricoccus solimangrovi]|uniref:Protoporphyrinogen IX oxidase n=1 Tax=Amaricoccus solimangrovi TaxID=2589815 RepID=A0A501WVV4_9RHOB|nr:protoporphyrinogen oxidase HemJ [Amaricoccus solimangrovi]TPE52550.1 protoporphyrinogen oxidase HemJ [Amaricoccus solimangrovi]
MRDLLISAYPWIKAFHIVAMVSWMAGLFYLPRLFVYHAERGVSGSELSETLKVMETKLLRYIMNPAMGATWFLGVLLALTPGVVDWTAGWFYIKIACVLILSGFQGWLGARGRDFISDRNRISGRTYRLANEIPTLALIVIAIMVVVRPF